MDTLCTHSVSLNQRNHYVSNIRDPINNNRHLVHTFSFSYPKKSLRFQHTRSNQEQQCTPCAHIQFLLSKETTTFPTYEIQSRTTMDTLCTHSVSLIQKNHSVSNIRNPIKNNNGHLVHTFSFSYPKKPLRFQHTRSNQ
jgi:hypothetical protein